MEPLCFHCVDLLQTGPAAPGTLEVLPREEHRLQKVAVGDLHGVVQVFSVKRGAVSLAFKTPPSALKIASLVTGRGKKQSDKIFVAAGNTIRGLTRKGREFFRLTHALTALPAALRVADAQVWAAADRMLCHHAEAGKQAGYVAPDAISAVELLSSRSGWMPVIACHDSHVRILRPDGQPLFEVATPSVPTALRYAPDAHGPAGAGAGSSVSPLELLYGCQDGRLVQLLVEGGAVRQGFTVRGGSGSTPAAAITAIHCGADYSKSGVADIVLGRDDGRVEVWAVDGAGVPRLAAAIELHESITALSGGYVTSAASPDIIVHTGFTGRVVALATDPAAIALGGVLAAAGDGAARAFGALGSFGHGSQPAGDPGAAAAQQADALAALNARIARETQELAELHARIARKKERCAAAQLSGSCPPNNAQPLPLLDVRHSLTLQPQDGCHVLSVDAASSLFALALHASVPLELLDLPASVAIVSRSMPEPEACATPSGGSKPVTTPAASTLATYRCQESMNRLSVRFRAREAAVIGAVTAFVVPAAPSCTCPVLEATLAPLCLHQTVPACSVGAVDGETALEWLRRSRPVSELVLSGSFSVADAHAWLRGVLPGLPPAPASASGGASLHRHVRLGSLLAADCAAGQVVIAAEHLSTLCIAHDALLAAATATGTRVGARIALDADALRHSVQLLWPAVEAQALEARRRLLCTALQELREQEGADSWLAPEYAALLTAQAPAPGRGVGSETVHECCQAGGAADVDAAAELRQLALDYARLASGGVPSGRALAALDASLGGCALPQSVDAAVELLLCVLRAQ